MESTGMIPDSYTMVMCPKSYSVAIDMLLIFEPSRLIVVSSIKEFNLCLELDDSDNAGFETECGETIIFDSSFETSIISGLLFGCRHHRFMTPNLHRHLSIILD